jgi:hypothetical protein
VNIKDKYDFSKNSKGHPEGTVTIAAEALADKKDAQIATLTRDLAAAREQLASLQRRMAKYSTEHVPAGFRPVVAFMNDTHVSIMADSLTQLGEEHNCDANGCGQEHVAYYLPLNAWEQLAAANATVEKCKAAGFIDEQGNVRKVLGEIVTTADGFIVGNNCQVWLAGVPVGEKHQPVTESFRVTLNNYEQGTASDGALVNWGGPYHDCADIRDCFSTRTAAEAAREGKGTT